MSFQFAPRGAVLICPKGVQYGTIDINLFNAYQDEATYILKDISPKIFGEWMFNLKSIEKYISIDATFPDPIPPSFDEITQSANASVNAPSGTPTPPVFLPAPQPNLVLGDYGPGLYFTDERAATLFYSEIEDVYFNIGVAGKFFIHNGNFYFVAIRTNLGDMVVNTITDSEIEIEYDRTDGDYHTITTYKYTITSTFYTP